MTLFYYDGRFLDHDTGPYHPERAERLTHVIAHLTDTGIVARCNRPEWQPVTRKRLERVHASAYIDRLSALAARGGAWLDSDTAVSPASPEVAQLAAGAACDALDRVLGGDDKTAFCLVRPPGHHALPERAMGFCLFNHVAVAAKVALEEHQLDRVLIVDWDVHHGNGTQDIFYSDGRVGFFSIHRWPFYPGTGAADETGAGDGIGATCNVPVEFGTPQTTYFELFRTKLQSLAERIRPQLVLISAGFDAHRADPVGSLGLEAADFAELTTTVLEIAATYADGRTVSLLEGGYNPAALAACAETHLTCLLNAS
jgi:acetoin utilization deacetylase AcuC-like enzyme